MKMIIKYNRVFILLTLILAFCGESIAQVRVNRRSSDRTYTFNITNNPDDSTISELSGSLLAVKYQPLIPYQQLYAKVLTSTETAALQPGVYVIDTTVVVDGSVTIPDGVFLILAGDSSINVPDAADTLKAPAGALLTQRGRVQFYGSGQIRTAGSHLYAENFGVVADGSTNNATKLQWASDALMATYDARNTKSGRYGTLELPEGKIIVNPTTNITFLPDSGHTMYIIGQGDGTVITQRSGTYGDLFVDYIEAGNSTPQGTVHFSYFTIDSTTQGLANGTSGSNAFGIVLSHSIIEHIKIYRAGNRAIAYEGYDVGYAGTAQGFGNVTIRDVEIHNAWKNAISVNKHDYTRIQFVRIEDVLIDGFSEIVPDSGGQGTGFASQGINLLARAEAYNPGHDFFLTRVIVRNGHSNALDVNGLTPDNLLYITDCSFESNNVDSATTPAAVLITSAYGGTVNGLRIHETVGGPAWRDRTGSSLTGSGKWNITNMIIDSTTTGTAVGYAMDLFGTNGYMVSNSRILDNARGFYINNNGNKWGWLTNSHIRGDSLGYYTFEFDLRDVLYTTGSFIEPIESSYTTTGQDIIYNGRFKADSSNVIMSQNGDGLPDGWNFYCSNGPALRDSLITYIHPDSGLVIRNISSQLLTFIFRQDVTPRLSGSDTYTINVEVTDANPSGIRTWVNAGPVGSNLATGLNQQTGQTVTSYVGVGRSGAVVSGGYVIIDYIECLVE